MTSNGPIATTLTLLTRIPYHAPGTKIRFLGCVTSYTTSTGTLTLQHPHPHSCPPVLALVDVDLVLEGLKREEMEVGAWLNIVGYVEGMVKEIKKRSKRSGKVNGEEDGKDVVRVGVKAVILWGARGLKVEEYEKSFGGRVLSESV